MGYKQHLSHKNHTCFYNGLLRIVFSKVWILALPLGCVTLGKSPNLSEPPLPWLGTKENDGPLLGGPIRLISQARVHNELPHGVTSMNKHGHVALYQLSYPVRARVTLHVQHLQYWCRPPVSPDPLTQHQWKLSEPSPWTFLVFLHVNFTTRSSRYHHDPHPTKVVSEAQKGQLIYL